MRLRIAYLRHSITGAWDVAIEQIHANIAMQRLRSTLMKGRTGVCQDRQVQPYSYDSGGTKRCLRVTTHVLQAVMGLAAVVAPDLCRQHVRL